MKRSVNFMLWDFVVFDVHESDRLPSAVLSGEKENSHCGFNLFYDFNFAEREVYDRDGGTDGSHDRCTDGLVVRLYCFVEVRGFGKGSYRVCGVRRDKIYVRTRQIRGSLPPCAPTANADISPKY